MRQKSIKKNAFLSMIQSFVSMAFPLITFPYAARVLGVSGIGRYNFSYTFVNYFALIASLGINTYAVREGARLREDKKKLEEFASEVFSINVVSTILAYILLIVLTATVTKFRGYASVIMILSGKIICDTLGRNWLYALYEDYAFITIRSIISQIFSLVLLFLLVKGPGDIELYAFVSVSSTIISGILNLIFSCKYCGLQFSWKLEKKHIVPILLIFSTTVSIIIYSNTDITILGFFGTDKHIGLYSSSVKVYNIIKQIIAASLTVSIPRFSYYLGNKMFAEYNHLYNKITNTLLTLVIPAIAGLMFLSQEIIVLACGEEFIEAWKSLSILSVSMFFNLMTYLLGYCVLIPHRKEKNFFFATITGAAVNLILNFIFIPLFFQDAAAMTTNIAEFTTMIICAYYAKGLVVVEDRRKMIMAIALGCIFIFGVCILLKYLCSTYYIILLVAVPISIAGYFVIQAVMKNWVVKDILKLMRNKIRG